MMFIDLQSTTTKKTVDDEEDDENDVDYDNSLQTSIYSEMQLDSTASLTASEKWKRLRSNIDLDLELNLDLDSNTCMPLGTSTTNMAEYERLQKSLRDIPYAVTSQIMRSMDLDKGWEDLAAAAGFTLEKVMVLKSELSRCNGSPTRSLLLDLGCQDYKVHDLYEKLKESKRTYEMNILKEYILKGGREPKYSSLSSSSSSQSNSLQSLISQLDITVPQSRVLTSSGYNSSSGSDVNFNRHQKFSQSKAQVDGMKVYDDKVIPGAEHSNSYSGTASKFFQAGASLPSELRRHAQRTAIQPHRYPQQCASVGTEFTLSSTPSSICPSANSSYDAAQRLMSELTGETKHAQQQQQQPQPPQKQHQQQQYPQQPQQQKQQQPYHQQPQQQRVSPIPCEGQSEEDAAIGVKASFTYNEISLATHGFDANNCVGSGAFGTVFFGCLRGQECAVKRLNKAPTEHSGRSSQIKKELTALLKYQHKNIVTLYGYALDGPHVCLVYELLKNGSLDDRLQQKNNTVSVPWERRLNILVGVCQGLNFLHTMGEKPLLHGDIKSANILLDRYLEAKICDLGQAHYAASGDTGDKSSLTHITVAESSTKLFSSRAYQAPEILNRSSISIKSDVFAVGVVILEVCSGLKAFDVNRNENKFLVHLFKDQIRERDESEWIAEFGDKRSADLIPGVFLELLKLADKCIKDLKKARPDSAKLLEEVEHLYNQENDDCLDSVTSSMRANSGILSHTSNYQQNLSEELPSQELSRGNAMVSQGRATSPLISIHLQSERMKEFSSPPSAGYGTSVSSNMPESRLTFCPSDSPESFMHSEPHFLQDHYDKNPWQRIDKLPASVADDGSRQSFRSVDTTSPVPIDTPVSQPTDFSSTDDYIPPADPQKLAKLVEYDRQNFTPSSMANESDSIFSVPACSREKLQYLNELDDSAYLKQSFPSHQTAMPFTNPTAETAGNLMAHSEVVDPQQWLPEDQSSGPTISSSGVGANPSTTKRDSSMDNNAVDTFVGQLDSAAKSDPAKEMSSQVQECDSAHQGMDGREKDFHNLIQKRHHIFSAYKKAVESSHSPND